MGKLESTPVDIYVSEPQRIDDREVWTLMIKELEYDFFMQSGDLLQETLTDQENKVFVDTLENLINYYAGST